MHPILIPLLLLACKTDKPQETADTGLPPDTSTAETGSSMLSGVTGRVGTATATAAAYDGDEEWYFTADDAQGGADLCRIRFHLASSTPRTDCDICAFAFDLVVSGAQVLADAGPGCFSTTGYDASTVGTLDGTVRAYGYAPDYFGHVQRLMMDLDGTWTAVSAATWDEATGALAYDWNDGYFEYPGD